MSNVTKFYHSTHSYEVASIFDQYTSSFLARTDSDRHTDRKNWKQHLLRQQVWWR